MWLTLALTHPQLISAATPGLGSMLLWRPRVFTVDWSLDTFHYEVAAQKRHLFCLVLCVC